LITNNNNNESKKKSTITFWSFRTFDFTNCQRNPLFGSEISVPLFSSKRYKIQERKIEETSERQNCDDPALNVNP
jgi:hypothetical protein